MSEKSKLRETIAAAQARLNEIEATEAESTGKLLVGKCFKYPKNCYSLPCTPEDYWPVYLKVMSADGAWLRCVEFQTDKDKNITIEFDRLRPQTMSDYVRIDDDEFALAWNALVNRIKSAEVL